METLEKKTHSPTQTVWTNKGKIKCKLPFLKMSNDYEYVAVEFYYESRIICAMYGNIPDENGLVNVYGFGMFEQMIGVGLGKAYFLESFRYLHNLYGVLGLKMNKLSCNKFSTAMIQLLGKMINENNGDRLYNFSRLEYIEDEQYYIFKLKNTL